MSTLERLQKSCNEVLTPTSGIHEVVTSYGYQHSTQGDNRVGVYTRSNGHTITYQKQCDENYSWVHIDHTKRKIVNGKGSDTLQQHLNKYHG